MKEKEVRGGGGITDAILSHSKNIIIIIIEREKNIKIPETQKEKVGRGSRSWHNINELVEIHG